MVFIWKLLVASHVWIKHFALFKIWYSTNQWLAGWLAVCLHPWLWWRLSLVKKNKLRVEVEFWKWAEKVEFLGFASYKYFSHHSFPLLFLIFLKYNNNNNNTLLFNFFWRCLSLDFLSCLFKPLRVNSHLSYLVIIFYSIKYLYFLNNHTKFCYFHYFYEKKERTH